MDNYDPTSQEECREVCDELGIDADEKWGEVNNFACDCYHAGQSDIMRNGPTHLASGSKMTKEEALAWIERIYS